MLQNREASLCNQFLLELSSSQYENMQRCYKHIEDAHVTFGEEKIMFDKISAFANLKFQTLAFSMG